MIKAQSRVFNLHDDSAQLHKYEKENVLQQTTIYCCDHLRSLLYNVHYTYLHKQNTHDVMSSNLIFYLLINYPLKFLTSMYEALM
jgi:hypothetical protein